MNTELILTIYTVVIIICNMFWWLVCSPVSITYGLCFLNPLYIHENTKLNWFGTVFVCIVANLAFGPMSLLYWIYKSWTVGRR